MELEKMYQWLQICKDRHAEKAKKDLLEEKENSNVMIDDIDNLIQDTKKI
jgi:hypothetical protein